MAEPPLGSPTPFRRKATRGGDDPVPRWVSYEALAEPAQAGKSRPQKFALYERYFLYLYEREAFAARKHYLQDNRDWQRDIRPKVEAFLRAAVKRSTSLRLILDAHASIAFLAGAVLDLKSGVQTQLVQKGRVGATTWRPDDGTARNGARFEITEETIGVGQEIAIAISISQPAFPQARAYARRQLPNVGRLISFAMPAGPGHQTVAGGEHAAALAEQVSNFLRSAKAEDPDAMIHVFAACPNSVLFFLGQQHQGIAPCIVYEFDFDRKAHKTYQASFIID